MLAGIQEYLSNLNGRQFPFEVLSPQVGSVALSIFSVLLVCAPLEMFWIEAVLCLAFVASANTFPAAGINQCLSVYFERFFVPSNSVPVFISSSAPKQAFVRIAMFLKHGFELSKGLRFRPWVRFGLIVRSVLFHPVCVFSTDFCKADCSAPIDRASELSPFASLAFPADCSLAGCRSFIAGIAKSCIISVSHLDTPCCIDVVRRSFGLQSGRPLCILQHGGQ